MAGNHSTLAKDGSRAAPVFFVEDRTDGFGSRLLTLLNAIVAARCYDGKLAFNWRPLPEQFMQDFHVVSDPSDTFTSTYLSENHLDIPELRSLNSISIADVKVDENGALLLDPGVAAIIMDTFHLKFRFGNLFSRYPKTLYPDAFDTIRFSEPLEYARSLAKKAGTDNSYIAVHLRAGDIVFGPTRYTGSFVNKIIPYQLARAAIKAFMAHGKSVLVFGEDEAMCRHISLKCGAQFVGDMPHYDTLTSAQKVLYEICLMSQCEKILQGHSAFAEVASWIGGVKVMKLPQVITAETAINATRRMVRLRDDGASDLQRAFAAWHTLWQYPKDVNDSDRALFIDSCISLDPGNPFYRMLKAHDLYRTGKADAAENMLLTEMERKTGARTMQWLWGEPGVLNMIKNFEDGFREAAAAGHPVAALCLAYRGFKTGDLPSAKAHASLYITNRGNIRSVLEDEIETLLVD